MKEQTICEGGEGRKEGEGRSGEGRREGGEEGEGGIDFIR